ncbi:hypothetical protein EDB92DRAFT_2016069 [Lactarius akahatsu]|uniref:Uncharacterized protein n=1 Tax=Lactarius akahatsu TaxID=416441 RepID=A0AAD4Q8Q8_9AGAM|nr:hypothetical protein EDB92DRAFT_2016069 [Lactarius akahatsu]
MPPLVCAPPARILGEEEGPPTPFTIRAQAGTELVVFRKRTGPGHYSGLQSGVGYGSPTQLVRRPGPPFCAKGGAKGGVRLFAYPLSHSAPHLRASLLHRDSEGAPLHVCVPPLHQNEGRQQKGGLPTWSPARVSRVQGGGWSQRGLTVRVLFARNERGPVGANGGRGLTFPAPHLLHKWAQGVLSRGWRGQMRGQPFPPFAREWGAARPSPTPLALHPVRLPCSHTNRSRGCKGGVSSHMVPVHILFARERGWRGQVRGAYLSRAPHRNGWRGCGQRGEVLRRARKGINGGLTFPTPVPPLHKNWGLGAKGGVPLPVRVQMEAGVAKGGGLSHTVLVHSILFAA